MQLLVTIFAFLIAVSPALSAGQQRTVYMQPPGWVAKGVSIDIDFQRGRYWSKSGYKAPRSLLTTSRSAVAYGQTLAGTLISFAANITRTTDQGVLIEESRTNTVQQSQTLTASPWATNLASVTADQLAAPDGTVTADLLTYSGNGFFRQQLQTVVATSTTYTVSGYVHLGTTATWAQIALGDFSANAFGGWFNLNNGTVGSNQATGGGSVTSKSITPLGNGWYRISVTGSSTAWAGGITYIEFEFVRADGSTTRTSGDSGYIWGAQLEQAAFATSYIATVGTSVARSSDNVVPVGEFLTTLQGAAWSAAPAGAGSPNGAGNPALLDKNGTTDTPIYHRVTTTTAYSFGNSVDLIATLGSGVNTGPTKYGVSTNAAGRSLAANGGAVVTDANAFGGVWTPKIGSVGAVSEFYDGYITRFSVWNYRMPDGQLREATR